MDKGAQSKSKRRDIHPVHTVQVSIALVYTGTGDLRLVRVHRLTLETSIRLKPTGAVEK